VWLICIKVNSDIHLSYLALQRIPEGSSPLPCYLSYLHTSHATSEGAVHLSLFMSESQFNVVILSEKKRA
jgi:hypothetical protein